MTKLSYEERHVNIGELLGLTLTKVWDAGSEVHFEAEDGRKFMLYHDQDCCESVTLEDVCGDLQDLVGSPITMAEEVSGEPPADHEPSPESETWTFYKFATVKGYVTLRWYGESNGFYSESVDFERYV